MSSKGLDIMSAIFFVPTDIHPTAPFIYKDRERVGQVDKGSPRVRDFMHGEPDTLMPTLNKFRLVLNEPEGAAPTFCKPAIQIFNSQQVPLSAEGTSHHQGIHSISMGLKVR
jgi:hypothetical protein